MAATALRPRRVGEILDAGIKIYTSNARTLMGLTAVVIIPVQVLEGIVLISTIPSGSDIPNGFGSVSSNGTAHVSDAAARLGAQVTISFVALIAGSLVTAACVKAVSDSLVDHPTGIAASLRFAAGRLAALVWMEILLVLGLILAFLALVVPGIWLYGAWSVAVPALLIDRLGPVKALRRSRRLVKGRWWPAAGVLLVSTIMVTIIAGAFQALLVAIASLPSQPSLGLAVLVSVLSGAISAVIVQPFRAAVVTVLYYDLRVRREGYDLQVLADQLGLPALSAEEEQDASSTFDGAGWPIGGIGPESVGKPGGPPFWPPPPDWKPTT